MYPSDPGMLIRRQLEPPLSRREWYAKARRNGWPRLLSFFFAYKYGC